MLVAVVADIHSNPAALAAVLTDATRAGAEECWMLGDLVGYCSDPAGAFRLVSRARRAQSKLHITRVLLGNHDATLLRRLDQGLMESAPRDALSLNEARLGGSTGILSEMAAEMAAWQPLVDNVADGVVLAHGKFAPGDDDTPLTHYTRELDDFNDQHKRLQTAGLLDQVRLVFVGHSHLQLALQGIGEPGGRLRWDQLVSGFGVSTQGDTPRNQWEPASGSRQGTEEVHLERVFPDGREGLVVVNPGSVGLPRDGAKAGQGRCWAKYALFDTGAPGYRITFCRVPYDSTQLIKDLKDVPYPGEVVGILG